MPLKPPPGFHPVAVPAGFHPVASAAPMATVSAAPKPGIGEYLHEMEQDLEKGGRRTFLGEALGFLQGRGDQGYNSPGTTGAAYTLMSPIEAPLKIAQGVVQSYTGHPIKGMENEAKGALQGLSLPASFVAPEAGESGQEIESVLGIPTKTHAGQILDEIGEAAGRAGTTVPTKETVPALQEWRSQLEAGGKPGGQKAIQSLATRLLGTVRRPLDLASEPPVLPKVAGYLMPPPEELPLAGPHPFIPDVPGELIPARSMPQEAITGAGTNLEPVGTAGRTRGVIGRQMEQLGSTAQTVPPRLMREAYMTSGTREATDIPRSGPGVWLRRPEIPPQEPAKPWMGPAEPMPWQEARLRYSHITEQEREPLLQRLTGKGMSPKMKAAATGVQSALREELGSAAESLGRGQQFQSAMAEYRHAAQLAKAARIAGMIGLGELARSSGLLGRILPHYLPDKQ